MRNHPIPSFTGVLCFLLLINIAHAQTPVVIQEPGEDLKRPTALLKAYSESIQQSGVPTPGNVDTAFKDAETANTLESWSAAARLANTYAHIVDILCDHYTRLYQLSINNSGNGDLTLITVAANYEGKRDDYRAARNLAYLKIARLHLAQGNKAEALSYALTAIELSTTELNQEAETLIRQIIEYKQ